MVDFMPMEDELMAGFLDQASRELAATIRREREDQDGRKWSQESLAARMRNLGHPQWRQTTVAKVEAGTRPVSLAEAISLAHALGLARIEDLFGEAAPVDVVLAENFAARSKARTRRAADEAFALVAQTSPETAAELRQLYDQNESIIYGVAARPSNWPKWVERDVPRLLAEMMERVNDDGVDREA